MVETAFSPSPKKIRARSRAIEKIEKEGLA
jgi:hypothetical protein